MTERAELPTYVLGHSQRELKRLIRQAELFEPATEQLFRMAGLRSGMSVLDVGSGAGDVSFIAARLVGPSGKVVGIDNSADAIALADARAQERGLWNVRFVQADLNEWTSDRTFDAVVGRHILLHQPDAAASLRQVTRYVRPGGLVIFQEFNFPDELISIPPVPLYHIGYSWVHEAISKVGWDRHIGLRLYPIFIEAGLPAPKLIAYSNVEAGPDSTVYEYLADVVHTFLPLIERFGVATADEIQVDTIAERLRSEALARQAILTLPPVVGAWTRK